MKKLIFFLVLNLFGCGSSYEEAIINEKSNNPDQESWGVTIILTDGGIIRAKIKSGHLEKYNEKEFILLDSMVIVDFYDDQELHTSTLTSNQAEVDQSSNDMRAIGNVLAQSDSGISLYTDTLIWDSNNEKMSTINPVMITTEENDTLYGVGFESDSDLKNWKILKPSGVINKAEL